jgi:RNA:NAD 2'-phosphotransferase (TPT1/KptA family)
MLHLRLALHAAALLGRAGPALAISCRADALGKERLCNVDALLAEQHRDRAQVALSKQLSYLLRHRANALHLDAGGWMDIHTVCYLLQTQHTEDAGVTVNKLVALVRATRGER